MFFIIFSDFLDKKWILYDFLKFKTIKYKQSEKKIKVKNMWTIGWESKRVSNQIQGIWRAVHIMVFNE